MSARIEKKTDEEMRESYPIADRLPGWYFRVTEISNGAWRVEGSDAWGRTVSRQGVDPEQLLAECVEAASDDP